MAFTATDVHTFMVVALFLLGVATFGSGVFVLAFRAMNNDMRRLAAHTARLAQKGIVEEAVGVVGNAVALMRALNEVIRTATGIGLFLIFLGSALIYAAVYLNGQCAL